MRMLGGVSANGPSCSPIVSASRTESAPMATLGVNDYNPLLQSRRRRLAELRTGLDEIIVGDMCADGDDEGRQHADHRESPRPHPREILGPGAHRRLDGRPEADRDEDHDLAVHAYESWGFKDLSRETIDVLNRWAHFIYAPLLERLQVGERVDARHVVHHMAHAQLLGAVLAQELSELARVQVVTIVGDRRKFGI